jgi:hypothetical protein
MLKMRVFDTKKGAEAPPFILPGEYQAESNDT